MESRIVATHRLQQEGRWDEASAFRDSERQRLRAEGKTKSEANELAWASMLEKFTPLVDSDVPKVTEAAPALKKVDDDAIDATDLELDEMLARPHAPTDLIRDILWAYESLGNRRVRLTDAPSCGAWSLLTWARSNRNRFFEQTLPKALGALEKQPQPSHRRHDTLPPSKAEMDRRSQELLQMLAAGQTEGQG